MVFSSFVRHALLGQHVLQMDNCNATMMVIPVSADAHNVVAPGPGIFAQIKPDLTGLGVAPIPDPPPSVLNLSHIKARRLEGRSYLYIWALGVTRDTKKLSEHHQMAYWEAMVDYVISSADASDLPVVVEVTSEEMARRYEEIGIGEDGNRGFKRIEMMELPVGAAHRKPESKQTPEPAVETSEDERSPPGSCEEEDGAGVQQWYLMIRPPPSFYEQGNEADGLLDGVVQCARKTNQIRSGDTVTPHLFQERATEHVGDHHHETTRVKFTWMDPDGKKEEVVATHHGGVTCSSGAGKNYVTF